MAITYTWKITALKKAPSLDGLSDVITHINFEYKGVDGDHTASFMGACPVPAPDAEDFTPLADLKEAEVIEWAKENHPTPKQPISLIIGARGFHRRLRRRRWVVIGGGGDGGGSLAGSG